MQGLKSVSLILKEAYWKVDLVSVKGADNLMEETVPVGFDHDNDADCATWTSLRKECELR